MEDVFAVQDEIARCVVHALGVRLSEAERETLGKPAAADVRAFDYYLQARKFFYQYSRKSMRFARELSSGRSRSIPPTPGRGRGRRLLRLPLLERRPPRRRRRAGGHREPPSARADPALAEAHTSRGAALSLLGRHEEAERAFEAAIRLDPGLFEAHYFYARDAFARGEPEKAIRQYEAAMRARPEDYQSPLLVGQIFEDLGRSAEAQAVRRRGVRIAEEHLRLRPDDARALYMGANGLVALGETARGLEWADRALALDPEDAMLLYNIGCIRAMAGAADGALDCLERSVRRGHAEPRLARARQQPRHGPLGPALRGPHAEPRAGPGGSAVKKDPRPGHDRLISGKLRAKAGRQRGRPHERHRGRRRVRLVVPSRLGRLGQGLQGGLDLRVPAPERTRELILDFTLKVNDGDGTPSDARVLHALASGIRSAREAGWDPESRGRAFRHEIGERSPDGRRP